MIRLGQSEIYVLCVSSLTSSIRGFGEGMLFWKSKFLWRMSIHVRDKHKFYVSVILGTKPYAICL